jgi:hypothetical protein
MRRLAWIVAAAVGILVAIVGGYRWFESSLAADRRKVIADTTSDFRQHQPQYSELITAWRNASKASNPCGLPVPAVGMVEFRLFEINGDGTYRVAVRGDDKKFTNLREAASALSSAEEGVQALISGLRSVGRSEVYQHDAEIRVPTGNGASSGVLFVSSNCPQAARYEAESRPGAATSFVNLEALGGGWYYYAERR